MNKQLILLNENEVYLSPASPPEEGLINILFYLSPSLLGEEGQGG